MWYNKRVYYLAIDMTPIGYGINKKIKNKELIPEKYIMYREHTFRSFDLNEFYPIGS